MLVFSAADFEDFREPRPDLPPAWKTELRAGGAPAGREALAVPPARHLRRDHLPRARRVRAGEPRRPVRRPALVLRPRRDHHASATSSASRRWAAASPSSTAWPFRASTSSSATAPRPPRRRRRSRACWHAGVPVGAGTDATRVASYNPWVGAGLAGHRQDGRRPAAVRPSANRLDRERRCGCGPQANTWFSRRRPQGPADRPASCRPRGAVGRLLRHPRRATSPTCMPS